MGKHIPVDQSIDLAEKSRNKLGNRKQVSASLIHDLEIGSEKRFTLSSSQSRVSQKKMHLFEEFFIIGIDRQDLIGPNIKDTKRLNPKTLYMHTGNRGGECERRKVVKDFCFPEGIQVRQLSKSHTHSHA
mmetsp:Transcript_21382/g.20538  ORF Transcript_21382/g.20538 Transcript_21382/m.20538 type:complete len:130 (+) Transcript_21382:2222-2611(+)